MKNLVGRVISAKSKKTVTVVVERLFRAPLYQKVVKKRKKFLAHDELGAKEGERVVITETRPISKCKRWRVVEILERPKVKKSVQSKVVKEKKK